VARKSMSILYGVSFALHASLGAGVAEIEPSKEPERLAITVVEAPKPKEQAKEEPPPPPPPPPPPKAKSKPIAQAPEAAPEPAPAPVAAAPTFGISMSGGVGMGGVAVPQGDSLHAPKEAVKRVAQAKTLGEPKQQAATSECEEPASKPKPLSLDKPEYTEEARAAAIEGKVRVQLTVSAEGVVTDAKILESLDPGLDQAALTAVRAATFEPAVHCGKPVEATFVVSIRFSL
jgi:periplasmic protein TonB